MQIRFLFVIAAIVGFLPNVMLPNLAGASSGASVFFSEDFESLGATPLTPMTADLVADGWVISNTAAAVELEAEWILLDTKFIAVDITGLPPGSHFGPATASGSTTPKLELLLPGDPATVPGGFFIGTSGDGIPIAPPTHPTALLESPINNGTYTGASNDIETPSFSTVGAIGDVWFHADVANNLNDGSQAIFDVDVSIDGGATWVNKFRRISPGNGRNIASGDFNSDVDVDGQDYLALQRAYDESDGPVGDLEQNRRNSAQRYSDWSKAYQGAYTPLVATTAGKDAGGQHGPLDINLGAGVGGEADVRVRFRHFEQRDDEIIFIDNIVVDETEPAGSEVVPIFFEDFNNLAAGLGSMGVYDFVEQQAFVLGTFDTGGGASTISGFSWGAQDRPSIAFPDGRYDLGVVQSRGVNHLGHPTVEGVNGEIPFALIEGEAENDLLAAQVQSERLHTPILDLSGNSAVILEWEDEIIYAGNPIAGSTKSVVLMEDSGPGGIPDGIPNDFDIVIAKPTKGLGGNTVFDPYLPYDVYAGGAFSNQDPIFQAHRLDITSLVALATDPTKLYVAFQYVAGETALGTDFNFWAIDNVRITGNGIPLSASSSGVPEPSSLLLALVGLPVFGAYRRRRSIG